MTTVGVHVSDLNKEFADFRAVDGIDLSVSEGEILALLGPSGCGKTTTLRCVAGLETPTSGEISIGGRVVYSRAQGLHVSPEKRGVGLVFQSYALWPHMTVQQNVAYGLKVAGLSRTDIGRRVDAILEAVELEEFSDRHPGTLSGGQQQRVALARSLVMEPKVLLFDEPLSNLDLKLRESMRRELRELVKRIGLTAIYVTHDQSEAMVIADQIVLMNRGRIEQEGEPRSLYERPKTSFAAEFLGSANFFDAFVASRDKQRFKVKLPSGLELEAQAPDRDIAGHECRIAIRPELIEFLDSSNEGASNTLLGTVRDREFLGSHTMYGIACDELFLRVQSPRHDYLVGDTVRLRLSPPDLLVLEG